MAAKPTRTPGPSKEDTANIKAYSEALRAASAHADSLTKSFVSQSASLSSMVKSMQEMMGTKEINAQLTQVNETLKVISEALKGMQSVGEIAFVGISSAAENASQATQALSENVREAGEAARKSGASTQGLDNDIRRAAANIVKANKETGTFSKTLGKILPTAILAAHGAWEGLIQGFRNAFALLRGGLGLFGSLAKGIFKVGAAIIAAPLGMLKNLITMADNASGAVSELFEAAQAMRKEFGALSGPTNTAIKGISASMNNLHLSGTSVLQVFGNIAERQKLLVDLFAQSGPNMRSFAKEVEAGNGAILGYQKGLGLSNEQMEIMAQRANITGKSMSSVLNNITKQSLALGKAFDLDAKLISKDMAKAAADVKHFGSVSEKQLGIAAAYAQKLGTSLDKITGTLDAFSTFDDAAEHASKLNEAFGTNIDMGKMLEAESPAQQLEILRKEFAKAGVDGAKLTRQQRALIAQNTNLDDATIQSAFATKNASVSLEKMTKVGDKAEKKTMTQAEAMDKLADAMERMSKAGAQGLTGGQGLFGALLKGFTDGIQRTKEFQGMIFAIKKVIMDVYVLGVKLGQAFVKMFPGISDIFKGITEKFKNLGSKIIEIQKKFFDPKTGEFTGNFEEIYEEIKKTFLNFFSSTDPAGAKVLGGIEKFFTAMVDIVAKAIPFLTQKLIDGIRFLTDIIKNPQQVIADLRSGARGAGGKIGGILMPLWDAISTAADQLWPEIKKLGETVWEKIKKAFTESDLGPKILKGAIAIILGPALLQGIAGALSGGFLKKAGSLIMGAVGKGAEAEKSAAAEAVGSVASQAAESGKSMMSSPAEMAAKVIPDKGTIERLQAAGDTKINWKSVTKFLVEMAAFFSVGLLAFKSSIELIRGEKVEDIAKAAVVMGVMVPVMKGMGELAESMAQLKDVSFGSLISTALALAAFMTVGLIGFYVALKVVAGVPIGDIIKAGMVMGVMGGLMYAAGPLIAEAELVGRILDKKGGVERVSKGILGMGAVMVVVAAAARGAIEILGKVKISRIVSTVAAMAPMGALFAGAGGLLIEAAAVGEIAKKTSTEAGVGLLGMAVVFSAVGVAAWAAIKALGSFKMSQVSVTVAAMTGMELLFAGAAGLFLAAVGVGLIITETEGIGLAAAAVGILAIGGLFAAVAITANIAISKLGKFKMSQVAVTLAAMGGMQLLFAGAGALVVEAAAVGVIVVASLGAALIGFAAMQKIVGVMSETAFSVIKRLSDIKEDPSALKTKADAFVSIIKSINDMMNAIANILKAMDFGFFETSAGQTAKIEAVSNMIDSLISGGRGGRGGIIGIMATVSATLANPDMSPEKLAAAKSIADIFSSLGTFIGAITGPAVELKKQTTSWTQSVAEDNAQMLNAIGNIIDLLQAMKTNLTGLIKTVVDVLAGLGTSQLDALQKGGQAIGPILSAVGQLASAVKPPDVKVDTGVGGKSFVKVEVPNMQRILQDMTQYLPPLLFMLIRFTALLPTDEQFKSRLEVLGLLMESLKTLAETMKEFQTEGKAMSGWFSDTSDYVKNAIKPLTVANDFLDQAKEPIKSVLEKVKYLDGVVKGTGLKVEELRNISNFVENLVAETNTIVSKADDIESPGDFDKKSWGEIIGYLWNTNLRVPDLVSKLNFLKDESSKFQKSTSETIVVNLGAINDSVEAIVSSADYLKKSSKFLSGSRDIAEDIQNELPKFSTNIQNIIKSLTEDLKIPDISSLQGVHDKILDVKSQINFTLSSIASVFTPDIKDQAEATAKVASDIEKEISRGILPAFLAVEAMTAAAAKLETSLQRGAKIDIPAKMKIFASQFGKNFGVNSSYTVKTQDVVLNVNFKIALEVDQVEKTMITHGTSVIRDRLNLLLAAVPSNTGADTYKDRAQSAIIRQGTSPLLSAPEL